MSFLRASVAGLVGLTGGALWGASYSPFHSRQPTASPPFMNPAPSSSSFAASSGFQQHDVVRASGGGAHVRAGHIIPGLPEYSLEDVAKRNGKSAGPDGVKRTWVIHKGGVYDVTDFIDTHPGGASRIKLAAGDKIDPFWKTFKVHNSDEVRTILEGMRVGNVKGYVVPAAETETNSDEEWKNEPPRHPALIPRSTMPFNAETPAAVLGASVVTSNDLFFVRNHMAVPIVDEKTFCLRVEGEGVTRECLTIDQLKRAFPSHSVTTTIQCGGNRRTDTPFRDKVKGLAWENGSIGTATWTGVWLRDILELASQGRITDKALASAFPESSISGSNFHVHFDGLDHDPSSQFQVSIPLSMAVDPRRDCLVAFEMNGQPIPRDHGFPLRAIVPGAVGVRNCKWLNKISVQSQESQSDWQQQDYKNFPSFLTRPDPSLNLPSIYDMPIQSAITEAVRDGTDITVKGYAYCGGGRGVQRVDISTDGGQTFSKVAKLDDGGLNQAPGRKWAWQLFESSFEVPSEEEKYTVCCCAWSDTQDRQPPVAPVNFRGLLNNGYSCVKL